MQIVFTDGLGNQMFQYALYLEMCYRGRKPKINIGIITRNIVHNGFELCNDFEIDKKSLPLSMIGKFAGAFTIIVDRYFKAFSYHQDIDNFSDEVFNTRKPFVYGYWQDCRYFRNVENVVRKSFTFRNIDKVNFRISEEMKQCNSVSLHIRRGDYLKYAQYQVCTPEYYEKAINIIKEQVEKPIFYIFSDDLIWSEEFLRNKGVKYVLVSNNRGKDSYKDMYLMSQCRHNIIANSSFSWWGAWLNEFETKIVLCPKMWLSNHKINPCPDNWIKISLKI